MVTKSKESRDVIQDLNQVYEYIEDRNFSSAKKRLDELLKERVQSYLKELPPASDVHLAHYTSVDTIYSILKDYRREDKKKKVKQGGYLRLYDAFSLNDPYEGKYLKAELSKTYSWLDNAKDETEAFVCSFVSGKKPIGDELIYWQSYGKDGLGCSIHLPPDKRPAIVTEKLNRIMYRRSDITRAKTTFGEYLKVGGRLYAMLPEEEQNDFATQFWKSFDYIKFLYKIEAYRAEKEYRCVVIPDQFRDGQVEIKDQFKSEGPYLRRYIEIPELAANVVLYTGSKVFIGPRVENRDRLCHNLKQIAVKVGLEGPAFLPSSIRYRKAW